jgi:hypothetical protein
VLIAATHLFERITKGRKSEIAKKKDRNWGCAFESLRPTPVIERVVLLSWFPRPSNFLFVFS